MSCAPLAFADGRTDVSIYVNGEEIDDGNISYLSAGTTYVPIREISNALGAERVEWTGGKATVKATGLELSAKPKQCYITANGRYLYLNGGCRMENGRVMLPVRLLCRAFGAEVKWDGGSRAVYITTTGKMIQSGSTYYDGDDLYWLARIIHAEASGESLKGKIAVGNVVLNRVKSPAFPNSVYAVVFDCKYGVQFTPAYSGSVYCTPSEESVIAAKLALDGADVAGNSLYFAASYVAASSWAGKNRPYICQIGNHCFYA